MSILWRDQRFLANQIKLNQTRLQVIRCDKDIGDSSDPPQFGMDEEMGDEEVSDDDDWSGEDDDDDDNESMRLDEEPFQIEQTLNLPVSLSSVQVKQMKFILEVCKIIFFVSPNHPHCNEKKREEKEKKCSMNTYSMFYY